MIKFLDFSQKFWSSRNFWVRISSTFSVVRPFSYIRLFLYFDLFNSTAYFDLCTSTFCQIWTSYWSRRTGRSTVLVEVKSVGRSTENDAYQNSGLNEIFDFSQNLGFLATFLIFLFTQIVVKNRNFDFGQNFIFDENSHQKLNSGYELVRPFLYFDHFHIFDPFCTSTHRL